MTSKYKNRRENRSNIFCGFVILHPRCRHSGLRQSELVISFGGINTRIDDICMDEEGRSRQKNKKKIQKRNNDRTLICLMERKVLSLVICCRCIFFYFVFFPFGSLIDEIN